MKTLLLGDISPTNQTIPYFEKNDVNTLFGDALSLFEEKDFIIGNLECALTEHDVPIKKFGPPLKAPYETAKVLKELGVNYVGLSNNHIFDFGIKGYEDTVKILDEYGIKYTGFGKNYEDSRKNLIVEKDGEKIAVIAVCEHEYSYALSDRMGSRPWDEYDTIEDIRNAKKENDRVIVMYHGGKEECRYPSPRLMKICRAMARNGADVVLCQHTHCIGCYEEYEGCHILYGQGNSHFVWNFPETPLRDELWSTALAVAYDTKENKIDFIPLHRLDTGIELAKGDLKEEIMSTFDARNKELHNGEWEKGWHDFCLGKKELYDEAILSGNPDRFAHYLDCEAHTDVWRELYKTWNHTNEKNCEKISLQHHSFKKILKLSIANNPKYQKIRNIFKKS